jgi:hypothetical protein
MVRESMSKRRRARELQKFRLRSTSFLGKNTATVFFGSTAGFDVPSVPLALQFISWARSLKGDHRKR